MAIQVSGDVNWQEYGGTFLNSRTNQIIHVLGIEDGGLIWDKKLYKNVICKELKPNVKLRAYVFDNYPNLGALLFDFDWIESSQVANFAGLNDTSTVIDWLLGIASYYGFSSVAGECDTYTRSELRKYFGIR